MKLLDHHGQGDAWKPELLVQCSSPMSPNDLTIPIFLYFYLKYILGYGKS